MVLYQEDLLHRMLRDDLYQKVVEGHNPHVPLLKTLEEVLKAVRPAELAGIRTRANAVAAMANAVVEAMPAPARTATKA